jgi:eukaryotic-like serine/threonine-protein kinase
MIGATISHYKILEKLGGGGMGVVYKAEDTTLKRIVALKFLPAELTSDPQAKLRFLHEAQAASMIEHANICDVHDIGQTDEGETYIVMSYYEGETLKKKIARGPLKVEQALEIGAQIADGLARAHAANIIHRDIKPANILVTKDGVVKILDFGLAKLKGESRLTQVGATVGTLAYMPPEQLQGQDTDARTDIWSLGVLLYEMLTGVLPFKGDHEGALLYEIMSADPPPITNLVHAIDPELEQLVAKCLEKDPEERYQTAKDLSVDCRHLKRQMKTLRQVSGSFPYSARGDTPFGGTRRSLNRWPNARHERTLVIVAAIFFCATVVLSVLEFGGQTIPELQSFKGDIRTPDGNDFYFVGGHAGPPALSPDGRTLAFTARAADGTRRLWIRKMNETKTRMSNNTENASYPFWSPDGQSIGFFSGHWLKKLDVDRDEVKEICRVNYGYGGSWSRGGQILFSSSQTEPIYRVSENGSQPVFATTLDSSRTETYHQFPFFLPDGDHFLFLARTTFTNLLNTKDEICVASLSHDGRDRKRLLSVSSNAAYSNGYLLYAKDNDLVAAPFDLNTLSIEGESLPVSKVKINSMDGGRVFTVSQNNILVYQQPPTTWSTRLVIYDRTGKEIGTLGKRGGYNDVRFSPDGKKIAYSMVDSVEQNIDIYIHDPSSPEETRAIGHSSSTERYPVWSRDMKEMVFASDRPQRSDLPRDSMSYEIYRKSLTSNAKEVMLQTTQDFVKQPFDWSPDGQYIAFVSSASIEGRKKQSDIYLLDIKKKEGRSPLINDVANEWDPRFSPDGKCIAWCSNASGQDEIYVSHFPSVTDLVPVSRGPVGERLGGRGPRWASDGRELFYLTLDNRLCVAEIKDNGSEIQVLNRRELFRTYATTNANNFDVSSDGKRIIINTADDPGGALVFISNWTGDLRRK